MVLILLATAAFAGSSPGPDAQRAAAQQWHEQSARAATASPTGLDGCAQVLGEPVSEKAFDHALERVVPNTRCVDVQGRVALLNPTVATTARYAPELLPWEPNAPAADACSTDGSPCLDARGVLHVPSSALLAQVRPPTRVDRPTRAAFRDAGLTEATVQVRILVSPQGQVLDAEVLEGPEPAHALALATIGAWQFQPVIADGRPRDVRTDLALTFRVR